MYVHVTTILVRAKYRMSLKQALEKLRNDIGKGTKENHLTDVCLYIFHAENCRFSFCHYKNGDSVERF